MDFFRFLSEEDKTMGMRKSVVLALILALFSAWAGLSRQALAQTRARTEMGKEVILYPDGTWKYSTETRGGPSSGVIYSKPRPANKFLKTQRGNFGVWYDGGKWKAGKPDDEGKVIFVLIGEDGYAMVIAEGMTIPTTSLK